MDASSTSEDRRNVTKAWLNDIASQRRPIIAVDLDDVLCQTSVCAAEWHNRRYGGNMTIDQFYYSMWYKNPGWGTVPETLEKVKEFYDTDQLGSARPVPCAAEGLRALEELGYDPVIVTARVLDQEHASTARWLETHFKGVFEHVIFTSQPEEKTEKDGLYIGTSLKKLEVCEALGAQILIDDLMETALAFGREGNRPVLLFGDYEWNKRTNSAEQWAFEEKNKAEGREAWWKDDDAVLREDDQIHRVRDWEAVIAWVKRLKNHDS